MSDIQQVREFAEIDEEAKRLGGIDPDALDWSGFNGSRAAVALSLFRDRSISTDKLVEMASSSVSSIRGQEKRTFVPIFTTNYCDSECKMCGMRKGNKDLVRKFSGKKTIENQLKILYENEHVRACGFLTGEYDGAYTRAANAFLIGWAIRQALDMGFERVYYNIGSMEPEEIEVMAEWLEPDEPVTMCVFQETYNRHRYKKFMGDQAIIPKSDFDRRIRSFDNWIDAGFKSTNPGFLVGVHTPEEEIASLCSHVEHLKSRGAECDISLPRLRPALGSSSRSKVDDETYRRVIAVIAHAFPEYDIVLTTRETQEFQDAVMPMIGVLSPGSPDVAPYKADDDQLVNSDLSSQFNIPDRRRPRDILARVVDMGYQVNRFEPPVYRQQPRSNIA